MIDTGLWLSNSRIKVALLSAASMIFVSCTSGQEERVVSSKKPHVEQPEQGYPIESLVQTNKASSKKDTVHRDTVKPGAAVVLVDSSARSVDDLDVHTLSFSFIASPSKGQLTVSLGSSDSLAIVSPQEPQTYDLALDELKLSVDVQAKSYGRHVLTFFTELQGLRRVVSVAVQAGPFAEQDSQKTSGSVNAPKVIPMKAQETISN